jgi:hypothetical protein
MSDNSGTLAIIIFFLGIAIYFLPSFNASSRKHPNRSSIFLLNLFLGWTLIGWVVSLVWSASSIAPPEPIRVRPEPEEDKYQKIERLGSLKEKGLLTESEYEAEKAKLLQS